MSSANLVAEIHEKLQNKRALSPGEPCTCDYVALLQSFHGGYFLASLQKINVNVNVGLLQFFVLSDKRYFYID